MRAYYPYGDWRVIVAEAYMNCESLARSLWGARRWR
jgi:hypothetical protein